MYKGIYISVSIYKCVCIYKIHKYIYKYMYLYIFIVFGCLEGELVAVN